MTKIKLLLVDDEEDMIFALKMELEANNFEVLTASDGQEALDKARKDRPDIILMDVMLPKLYGYKVCRMLKFDAKFKNIPIILFTSLDQKEHEKMSTEVGADACVPKPFEFQFLLNKIKGLIKN